VDIGKAATNAVKVFFFAERPSNQLMEHTHGNLASRRCPLNKEGVRHSNGNLARKPKRWRFREFLRLRAQLPHFLIHQLP